MMNRQQFLATLMALPFAGHQTAAARAPGPMRLVVGYVAGATIDTLARQLAQRLAPELGRSVIVENRHGAGGRIANLAVKAAPADGSTLLLTPSATMAIFPHSHAGTLGYDPLRDLVPIAHLCSFQTGLAVGSAVPVATLAEYCDWVRTDPGRRGFYASAATGSTSHFVGMMLGRAEGLALTHVPYPGTAAAMRALVAGEISALATGMGDLRTLARQGQARVLAINGRERDPVLDGVPTFQELGYDLDSTSWYALFAPAGLAVSLVGQLGRAAVSAITDPAWRRDLIERGLQPTGLGPDAMAALLASDHQRWGQVIRATGFTASG
ncbi:hypothetical protein GCM10007935_02760 [Hydrogenophaga electricum]|uniref:Twin-arginine translocation pathway signal protein n=2 Tax=Hydrogenophaga electricum TaxID=1230953 RepID=A0ABQ6BZR8_9BURK|nr:hypothetical protein GCM10007935_02760 [Hydrogenophaga electricum]